MGRKGPYKLIRSINPFLPFLFKAYSVTRYYFEGLLPRGASTKRETVLEAGRGVRKLPVPVVKSSSSGRAAVSGSPTKFERMLLNRSFDEAGLPREGGISRAADRDRVDRPMRPMDIPVTTVGGLMPPPQARPLQSQPLPTVQVFCQLGMICYSQG